VVFSSSILLVLSPNFYTVAGALTVLGFGMAGEITLAGTVFYEFCPPSKRYYMTLMSLFLVSGNIIETFIALMVSLFNNTGFYNWRVISAVGVVIEGCAMVSRFFMHETPAFLVSQNKQSAADEILNIICIKNTGKSLDRIENQASLNPNELTQEDKPIRNKEKTTGKMMRVFKPPLLKTTSFLGLVSDK
jgi:MFS family permease